MAKLYLGTREVTPAITITDSEPITDISKANYIVKTDGTVELLKKTNNEVLPLFETNDYGSENVYYNYSNNSSIKCVNLSAIESASMMYNPYGMGLFHFMNCPNLIKADISSLVRYIDEENSYNGRWFYGCLNLIEVNVSSLEEIGFGGFCEGFCETSLPTISFQKLKEVGFEGLLMAFNNCHLLETIYFPSLDSIDVLGLGGLVIGSTSIKDIYFNSLKTTSFLSDDAFEMMLADTGTDVVHTLHFPSNLQSTISQLVDYPLFSGESGYVVLAFDLPATS